MSDAPIRLNETISAHPWSKNVIGKVVFVASIYFGAQCRGLHSFYIKLRSHGTS